MWPLILGGAGLMANAYGAQQQIDMLDDLKGPDLDKINTELSPWQARLSQQETRGRDFMNRGSSLMDYTGQYQTDMRKDLVQNVNEQTALDTNKVLENIRRTTGGVGGSYSTLLDAMNRNRSNETIMKGFRGIQQQAFGQGLGLQKFGSGILDRNVRGFEDLSKTKVKALEAKRAFDNQLISSKAAMTAQKWQGIGSGLMGMGMGMAGFNPGQMLSSGGISTPLSLMSGGTFDVGSLTGQQAVDYGNLVSQRQQAYLDAGGYDEEEPW